ncbi:hypothetical protein [Actinomadura macrotermitis]|uniref:hypothetical protein n=1 Tax=Actinomadura macrotermitis TaxID=2585200 RepID=UPI0012977828|nr:hypothetical protein [Actinomadura macrotermitis]
MHEPKAGGSWHYFDLGGRLLFGNGPGTGLHLYAAHPELQFGPLSLLAAAPLSALGLVPGRFAAVALLGLSGPLMLAAVWALVPPAVRSPARLLWAGAFFLPVWAEVATQTAHLDDVLALGFTLGALHALRRRWPVPAGLLSPLPAMPSPGRSPSRRCCSFCPGACGGARVPRAPPGWCWSGRRS